MLAMSRLHDIPDETANRMSVRHGSDALLRAMRGEPEPEKPTLAMRLKVGRQPHLPVSARPDIPTPTAVREVLDAVVEVFGISLADLKGRGKAREYVLARAVAVRLIRDRVWEDGAPRHSLPMIGRYLGRDHSTICHALDNFDRYARRWPEVDEAYQALRVSLA